MWKEMGPATGTLGQENGIPVLTKVSIQLAIQTYIVLDVPAVSPAFIVTEKEEKIIFQIEPVVITQNKPGETSFVLCLKWISYKECTIDITLKDFAYISDHLTTAECHRLFALLHFVSYDLPDNLDNAVKKVPKDIPCVKLLLRWSSGQEKWEGKRKTHMEIEHRLQQIGRKDLADWLGTTVFHHLSKVLNNTLTNTSYFEDNKKPVHNNLVIAQDNKNYTEDWTAVDSILWVLLVGVLGTLFIVFCRLVHLANKKSVGTHKDGEELVDLLRVASVESDVEETIYEFRAEAEADKKNANDD